MQKEKRKIERKKGNSKRNNLFYKTCAFFSNLKKVCFKMEKKKSRDLNRTKITKEKKRERQRKAEKIEKKERETEI